MKLAYGMDGWKRTIRESDMKFQWVRVDDKEGDGDSNTTTTPGLILRNRPMYANWSSNLARILVFATVS
jgi:hypothetical protein